MEELLGRVFKIWKYTVSHSCLVIRSPLKFPDQEGYGNNSDYNIDVEFSAVAYINIPAVIEGLEIRELTKSVPKSMRNYRTKYQYKIFELKSKSGTHYIVAGTCIIGKNKWINEDRISNMNLEYDSMITFG